ncbi:MAG: phage tail protein, partial [Dehalococcoidia bacterium]
MTQAVDTSREDPLVGCRFKVDVGGVITGYFTECSGLGSETDIIEQKAVNEKGVEVVIKVPGRLKWGDITLKRGITSDMQIWNWRKQVED